MCYRQRIADRHRGIHRITALFENIDALADDLKTYGSEVIPNHENSKAIFWKDGEPLKKGDKLV
ncbi:hypothetical protein EGM92_33230, partial [Enterobacter cloacae]